MALTPRSAHSQNRLELFWTAKRPAGRGAGTRRVKSSHPDQFYQFQINPLQITVPGRCCFAGPDCGNFPGISSFLSQRPLVQIYTLNNIYNFFDKLSINIYTANVNATLFRRYGASGLTSLSANATTRSRLPIGSRAIWPGAQRLEANDDRWQWCPRDSDSP